MKRTAVYAGTFDILTFGHLWMIERGAQMFDRLVVAIGINPKKQCFLSLEDRLEALTQSTAEFQNVEVASSGNKYLVDYAQEVHAQFMLRGIRDEDDYLYERRTRNVNARFNPDITTVFLFPDPDLAEISSSMVREQIGLAGWESKVKQLVPYPVFRKLQEVYERKSA